ncbi:enoyl-CoA hydratase/isomerase family protein [Ramlibacter sp. AW1]|uniref:Enoyl-CoA hydratase/isomerase family protein n=1 Tax=Ramlibacter aurantiacus TaxID=2801330 RepID=A0A936ZL52_9BURK|nr:enoyl-CoA hydratase-related protein [Ramlibacter aurantiacus]MBL0419701.1 enoyl-CoA hydratase/isomerase family protein [Ramlibacter aurantiacus]
MAGTEPAPPLLEVADGIATVTLRRPAHRNRLEHGDLQVLMAHFEHIDADAGIRVLVLTAATEGQPRPVFCAGYHIGEFDQGQDPDLFEKVADRLARLRPVTVCGLNGSVYGGATDLVLACDFRVGLQGMELRMPAAALGLHYYPGGLRRYVATLGLQDAKRAFLSARPFSAARLLQAGVLDELAPSEESLRASVAQLAGEIAALAPLAVQAMKQSLNDVAMGGADDEVLRARSRLTQASEDFSEGRLAFQEKRQPRFVGR